MGTGSAYHGSLSCPSPVVSELLELFSISAAPSLSFSRSGWERFKTTLKLLTLYIFCPAILLPRIYCNKAFTNTWIFIVLLLIKIKNNLNIHHHESESEWKWKLLSHVRLFTTHGILQARMLEQLAFPFSRVPSQPRNCTGVSCIAGRFFTNWAKERTYPSLWECLNEQCKHIGNVTQHMLSMR